MLFDHTRRVALGVITAPIAAAWPHYSPFASQAALRSGPLRVGSGGSRGHEAIGRWGGAPVSQPLARSGRRHGARRRIRGRPGLLRHRGATTPAGRGAQGGA
jgi:hypothetical protein